MESLVVSVAVICVVSVALLFRFKHKSTLKLRIAVEMMGWEGVFAIVRESLATRIMGLKKTKSRVAYHELLDVLAQVDKEYCVPQRRVLTTDDIAESHRYVTHLLTHGLRLFYELDLDFPHFTPMVEPHMKLLGDNPDALYFASVFNPEHEYIVEGRLEREVYLSFTIYEQKQVGAFVGDVVADLNHKGLKLGPKGEYSILIGRVPDDKFPNFLSLQALKPGCYPQLVTRHYFEDTSPAQMNPEIHPRLNIRRRTPVSSTTAVQLSGDEKSALAFGYVQTFIREHSLLMPQDPAKAPSWFSFTPNVFGPARLFRNEKTGAGAVDIIYSAGPFKIEHVETEGLLITGLLPRCEFANIVLWNVFLQTLAYECGHCVSLNRAQLSSRPGFKILLSKRKPQQGLPYGMDWLDSEGRHSGTMFWRFLLVPEGEIVQTPLARVIANIDTETMW